MLLTMHAVIGDCSQNSSGKGLASSNEVKHDQLVSRISPASCDSRARAIVARVCVLDIPSIASCLHTESNLSRMVSKERLNETKPFVRAKQNTKDTKEDLGMNLPSNDPNPVSSGFWEGEHNAFNGTTANTAQDMVLCITMLKSTKISAEKLKLRYAVGSKIHMFTYIDDRWKQTT